MNINFKSPDHNNAMNLEQLKGEYAFTHTRQEMIRQGRSAAASSSMFKWFAHFFCTNYQVGQEVVVVVFALLCQC